ncbi:KDP operon transcriptional regulatory protein KdpE [Roseovarius sp. THAF8]|uniref:response regulator n=1 Tax=Roseovarius sp. THAF8 TaxID=2587846 RepID=UPI00126912DD|nr:response regulator [Roseovarius sp. THAF8]QFT98832.1 KDP operon transcriptional regulatory protein KdpE [Roseovarius sp. THAF8]
MDDTDSLTLTKTPTAQRPLLGLTILVVEDSRYACEAMRLMCLRSGARIRRADCLRSARRHLSVYRPSVVIVDLGLPDGSGLDLIAELSSAIPRVSGLLALSGNTALHQAAINAGADGFLGKPLDSLGAFQQAVLGALPDSFGPTGPREIPQVTIAPDPMAYRDDMTRVADLLEERRDGSMLDYVAQFLDGVARCADDTALAEAASDLAAARARGRVTPETVPALIEMVKARLTRSFAI